MNRAISAAVVSNGRPAAPAPRILLVIPAFNEAAALPSLIRALQEHCPDCDIVVIDDGSSDGTADQVRHAVRVVSLPCNLGIGGAVQTGLQIALREGYDYAVQVDGDGRHPAEDVGPLLREARAAGANLAVGSRFRRHEGFQSTPVRRLGIRLFAHLLSLICRTKVTDPTSGFRVLDRQAIAALVDRYAEDFPEVEAILQVHRAGLRILEVPVRMLARSAGKSSIGCFDSVRYMLKVLLAILMDLARRPKPAGAGGRRLPGL